MADPLSELLGMLSAQARHTPLPSLSGLVRIDVRDGERIEHRFVRIHKGDVSVVAEGGEPDCIMSGDRATIDDVVSGRANAMAALLRGALEVRGKIILLLALQRLFPAAAARPDTPPAGYARRRS
jgi:putative sterol carrier protein